MPAPLRGRGRYFAALRFVNRQHHAPLAAVALMFIFRRHVVFRRFGSMAM